MAVRQAVARKAPIDFGPGQHLVPQAVRPCRPERALEQGIVLRARVDGARRDQDLLTAQSLDLAPEFIGAPQ